MGLTALKAAGWPGLSSAALTLHGYLPFSHSQLVAPFLRKMDFFVLQLLWGMVPAAASRCWSLFPALKDLCALCLLEIRYSDVLAGEEQSRCGGK